MCGIRDIVAAIVLIVVSFLLVIAGLKLTEIVVELWRYSSRSTY